jgi:ArsR family transcriptional regulator, lead/cadmium/zinc/bismuth-responsive transcriptional repressor
MKSSKASAVAAETHKHPPVEPLPAAEVLEPAARLFRALGDAQRLRLLKLLARREHCVSEIVEAFGDKFPTVSQRLRLLHADGLISRRRDGVHIRYALADRHVVSLLANALEHAAQCRTARAATED